MSNINKPKIGHYVSQKAGFKSFTPFDFPPKGGFVITPRLYKKHEEAIRLVGKLDGITRLLPDKNLFLLMFVKKDAAYSSQIEGTKATLQDAVAAPVTEEKSRLHPDVVLNTCEAGAESSELGFWAGLDDALCVDGYFTFPRLETTFSHSHILKNVRMLRIWRIGIAAFFIQLFLNAIWSIIFLVYRVPHLPSLILFCFGSRSSGQWLSFTKSRGRRRICSFCISFGSLSLHI